MANLRNQVHPVQHRPLPFGYAIMSTGTCRLRYQVYRLGKPVGKPLGTVLDAEVHAKAHAKAERAKAAKTTTATAQDSDALILALLRQHRDEAQR